MQWTVPGTILQLPREEAAQVPERLRSMFLAGGIALSQVSAVTGLESYTIQNWVKRGFLTSPEKKRYSLRQLCRILNINMLKSILPMEDICRLLGYVNGRLNDESDDMIDDSVLYFMFVELAAEIRTPRDAQAQKQVLSRVLSQYNEPIPGARDRVEKVLQIMLTAWLAARLRQEAEKQMNQIKGEMCYE